MNKSEKVGLGTFQRLVNQGQRKIWPVLTWWSLLTDHWDAFDQVVKDNPFSKEWLRYGINPVENSASQAEREAWRVSQVDAKLQAAWAALGRLREVSDQPYDSPGHVAAMEDFSRACQLYSHGTDALTPLYNMPRELRPKWRDLEGHRVKPHDYLEWHDGWRTNLFDYWLGWETDCCESRSRLEWREMTVCNWGMDYLGFHHHLRDKKFVAYSDALRGIRQAIIAGRSSPDDDASIDWQPLEAAMQMDGGNFDADGQIIWLADSRQWRHRQWAEYQAQFVKN